MRLKTKYFEKSGLPRKTASAVICFAAFGVVALIWRYEMSNPDSREDSRGDETSPQLAQVGPLPVGHITANEKAATAGKLDSSGSNYNDDFSPSRAHQPIEDPEDEALCHFYDALEKLEHKNKSSLVRVLHYGDSMLTTDRLSGKVRRVLQRRFGDGGHGFILLGKPWYWYHHMDVKHGVRGEWRVRPLTTDSLRDGMFGLGGVAFETRESNAVAWVSTVAGRSLGSRVASFDISYLEQPRGGSFDVVVSGKCVGRVSTAAPERRTEHYRIEVPPGQAKLLVRTRGNGPVRLFGAVLESDQPGVVYDTLAINSARVSFFRRFNREHWKSELRHRKADLVILMIGANEGHSEYLALDEYEGHLSDMLKVIHEGVPEAACLVVGPLDQARRKGNGKLASRRMPSKLSQVQRKVSLASNCAFFDTFTAMGGENSMIKWFKNGLGGGDLVHPTEKGARQIGSWIAESLVAGYESYIFRNRQCASNVTFL